MTALPEPHLATPTTHVRAVPQRFVLAWAVMVVGLVGFWCCRPFLGTRVFNYGQLAVLLLTWKIASLLCLPPRAWARFTPLRFLAYCVWIGMQPRQFLVGERTAANAPIPTVSGFVLNVVTGLVLFWLVPRLLPVATPWAIRFWIALVGFCFLFLIARFDFWALVFRAMGFAVEKLWDCPIAATSLGDFWGRRWNRIVPGFLREVIFLPVAPGAVPRSRSWPCFSIAACTTNASASWPARDTADRRCTSCCNASVSRSRTPVRRRLMRGRLWLARAWTFAVVFLPVGLFLHPGLVDGYLVPMLVAAGVRGLER